MREIKSCSRWPVFLLISLLLGFSGCFHDRPYVYDDIRNEYREAICVISPFETDKTDSNAYRVNQPLTLSEAIRIAQQNNPENKMALFRIRQAEAIIAQTEAKFFPALNFYTEYLQGDSPSAYLFKAIDQRRLPPSVNFNDPGWFENFETGLRATLNLYNGGRDVLEKRMAENNLAIRQMDRTGVENRLMAAVIHAYYNGLSATDFIRIARESVSTVENQLRIMKVRFNAGGALKSDILSLEVRLAEAEEEVIRNENRLKTALAALSNLLGISPEMGITVSKADLSLPALPREFTAGLTYAMVHRAEIQKARYEVIQSKIALDKAKTGLLPRLDIRTKYYLDDPEFGYGSDRENYNAALMLNWDIFTGFSNEADERRMEAALMEKLAADRHTVLSIKTDVKTAYLNFEAVEARLAVTKKSVISANETFKLVKQQYEGGSATITRYLEAELSLSRSKTRSVDAFYSRETARADLARAIGYWANRNAEIRERPSQ